MRMGRVDCFATAVLVGPAVAGQATAMVQKIQRHPITADDGLLFGASELSGATVLRVAGKGSEAVGICLREKLAFISDILGMDPWLRKW